MSSLCVTDTGTGMTPEVMNRAFDPFFTTKPLGEGTGLGLSMVYGFARQSGGQVRIYSEVGKGTTMCLYLPRSLGSPGDTEPATVYSAIPGEGEVVLVVDDEPTIRLLVTEVLEEGGYATIEAHDGASALRILQSDARIDLLITDVGLPGGMNGRQVADAARLSRPALQRVVHHRLRRERGRRKRASRSRHGRDHQAVRDLGAGREGQGPAGWLGNRSCHGGEGTARSVLGLTSSRPVGPGGVIGSTIADPPPENGARVPGLRRNPSFSFRIRRWPMVRTMSTLAVLIAFAACAVFVLLRLDGNVGSFGAAMIAFVGIVVGIVVYARLADELPRGAE